jgi:hypothetical protein
MVLEGMIIEEACISNARPSTSACHSCQPSTTARGSQRIQYTQCEVGVSTDSTPGTEIARILSVSTSSAALVILAWSLHPLHTSLSLSAIMIVLSSVLSVLLRSSAPFCALHSALCNLHPDIRAKSQDHRWISGYLRWIMTATGDRATRNPAQPKPEAT